MKLIIILSLFFCLFISVIIAEIPVNGKDLKLKLVQVLLRHGARTPNNLELDISNFTLASLYAPLGLGQLTNKGKRQEYEFGKFLRNRYDNYLGATYKSKNVYAYSSASTRTQMSLQLVLAGLYPPKNSAIWNPRLIWSPIPYLYVHGKSDILLETYRSSTFRTYVSRALNSDKFKSKLANYSDFFKFVEERTIVKNIGSFWTEHSTFDILIANEFMNLPSPEWYVPEVRQKFMELEEILRDIFVAMPEMKKIGIGPLVKTFVKNMNLKGTTVNPKKIYLYSGHDANIAMFTRVHNISEFSFPNFGCALIFETLTDLQDRFYVRLLAWDGAGNLMTLKLNNRDFCPIEDYLKIIEDVIPSEEEINEISINIA